MAIRPLLAAPATPAIEINAAVRQDFSRVFFIIFLRIEYIFTIKFIFNVIIQTPRSLSNVSARKVEAGHKLVDTDREIARIKAA